MKIRNILLSSSVFFLFVSFASADSEKLVIGKFQSRAIWTAATSSTEKAPVVIMVPGSGANGPEEIMPSSLTADEKDHALFSEMSAVINEGGVHTLALGKPGIEFFSGWDMTKWFYDLPLYKGLRWQDLLDNLADAVKYVQTLPVVDPSRIFVLGHSEGTQVAVDYTATDSSVAGVILLGYSGEDIGTTVEWQLFNRDIEHFVATDVDANHDGYVTKDEASRWPEFRWSWDAGEEKVSYLDIETDLRQQPDRIALVEKMKTSPLYSDGIYNRGPIYEKTASLRQAVYVYTGAIDLQTRAKESLALDAECKRVKKLDCYVTLVPGVGHGFSPPRKPRAHPLSDITLGPIEPSFLSELSRLADRLKTQ